MVLKRKDNILKNKYFNFIAVPAITFIFIAISIFASGFSGTDKIIFTWLTIGASAFMCQYVMNIKNKSKYSYFNHLYILIAINISLFLGFLLERYVMASDSWWSAWIINPIVTLLILVIIKEVLWFIIAYKHSKKVKQHNTNAETTKQKNLLEIENARLKEEIKKLKNKEI